MSKDTEFTISVPAAGKRYFGLSRNGSYDAAARGDLLTVRVGRLLRVPTAAQERKIEQACNPPTKAANTRASKR
jgi:hypothetical protein